MYIVSIFTIIIFLDALKFLINIIIKILNYQVSIIIRTLIIIAIIVFLIFKLGIKLCNSVDYEPDVLNYTEQRYEDWYFKWEYFKINRNYSVKNIHLVCKCGCRLTSNRIDNFTMYPEMVLVCSNCNNRYGNVDSTTMDAVIKLIQYSE